MNDDARLERFRNLYAAVGFMTLRWAAVEMNLDILVNVIRQRLPTGEDVPRSLSRKTYLLRKWFTNFPELSTLKDDGIAIANHADTLADTRHWIVHGIVGDIPEFERSGELHLMRTRYGKQENHMDRKTIRIRDIDDCSVKLSVFMTETFRFGYAVQHALDNPG